MRYSISGTSLIDYWRYQHGRWVFDLVRSNPQAVRPEATGLVATAVSIASWDPCVLQAVNGL